MNAAGLGAHGLDDVRPGNGTARSQDRGIIGFDFALMYRVLDGTVHFTEVAVVIPRVLRDERGSDGVLGLRLTRLACARGSVLGPPECARMGRPLPGP